MDEAFADQIHKTTRKHFKRLRTVVKGIDEQHQADLCDMVRLTDENDGYRYLLTIIDCFSKYAWCIPVKNKNSKDMVGAFKSLFKLTKRRPKTIQADRGKEFFNKDVIKLLKDENITLFHTQDDHVKASIVERFNRTIKSMIFKTMTLLNELRYIDYLPDIVDSYNTNYHRSIKMTPIQASQKKKEKIVRMNLYGDMKLEKYTKPRYKLNDLVRISKRVGTFGKEATFLGMWSEQVYIINYIKLGSPTVYRICDLNYEPILGNFYEPELQKIDKLPDTFPIEKIIRTRGTGRNKEHLVKFRGYPSPDFDKWVQLDDIKKI